MIKDNKNKRQSRHNRSYRPKGMILQERDGKIIVAVFQYRYLTRSQIQRLFNMKCITRVNIRLRKLYDNEFLDRRFRPTVTGSTEAVYFLGIKSIKIVAEEHSMDTAEIKRRGRLDLAVKDHVLDHNLDVNDFRISLMADLENNPGFRLKEWRDPRDCESCFNIVKDGKTVKTSIRPDGYFELVHHKFIYSFFIEVDRSTSSLSKIRNKFEVYLDFKDRGLFKEVYGKENFYVLVTAKSKHRAKSLHKLAGDIRRDIFWVTTLDNTKGQLLFGDIWLRSGYATMRSLFPGPKVRIIQ